jgi:hypothetical protein
MGLSARFTLFFASAEHGEGKTMVAPNLVPVIRYISSDEKLPLKLRMCLNSP